MIVYRITNLLDGKVYIGKTKNGLLERWENHQEDARRGCSYYFHNAIRKYGSAAFKIEELYQAKTSRELSRMETFFIVLHQSHKPENGYNGTLGGDGGPPSLATRIKIANSKRGRGLSPEHRQHISEGNKGKSHPQESRIRAGLKLRGSKRPNLSMTWNKKVLEQRGPRPEGTSWCSGHQKYLPTEKFGKNKSEVSGLARYCLLCRSEQRNSIETTP